MIDLDSDDTALWQDVLSKASLELVKIVVSHSQKTAALLDQSSKNLLDSGNLSHDERRKLQDFENRKRCELSSEKSRKLKRDQIPSSVCPNMESQSLNTNIVNLSSVDLSAEEKTLLSKGLSFCPTTGHFGEFDLLRDLDNFARNLRLREYFHDKTNSSHNHMPWRSTTGWTPSPNRDKCLDIYIEAVQRDIMRAYGERNPKVRNNLTSLERNCLRSLSARKEITIKPADKGGAIVVLNTADYIKEGCRQLSDRRFYSSLDGNPTTEHTKIVTAALSELVEREKITLELSKLLRQLQPLPGRFYMLPKIHKSGNPGRPIISGNGTLTEPLSSFIDAMIKDIPPSFPSYIKDTNHFLREISSLSIPEGSFLVTLDPSPLYTNIPHDDGIAALVEAYEPRRSSDAPDAHTIAMISRLVLELNSFEFNDQFFLQISGTAMGTKMSPNYANIFMASIESKFLGRHHLKPAFYKRYIDDIFMIWTHSEQELLQFIAEFNTAHPNITLTHEYSKNSINFLDVTVQINGTELETKVYRKPSDRQEYLHYHSSHPRH
ncbi:unnamed protein product [Ixodes hexagonus]